MRPHDYNYIKQNGAPYEGMLALGDNMEVYTYDGSLGFFKKLFRKIKKGTKKAIKKAKQLAKKLLKKIPGGKYLLKLGEKLWKVSKKLVGPLAKLVGPIAKKLAPIAALIPGYGPAIAAGLHMTGKISGLMKKFNVKVAKKKGDPVGKLRFKSDKDAAKFQEALKAEAEKESRKGGTLNKPASPGGRMKHKPGSRPLHSSPGGRMKHRPGSRPLHSSPGGRMKHRPGSRPIRRVTRATA